MLLLLVSVLGAVHAGWVAQEADVRPYDARSSLWVFEKDVPDDHEVTLTIAMKVDEERRSALEKIFWLVSDPMSESYGKHLSLDEVTEVLGVPQARLNAVMDYFREHGASAIEVAPNRDMITLRMPAASVEKALKTTLGFFTHSDGSPTRIVRSVGSYSLPSEIDGHVELVGELLQFPRLRLNRLKRLQAEAGEATWSNECSAAGCNGLVTPQVLAKRYKLPNSSDAKGSTMAVAEFQGQFYKPDDLKKFSDACHRNVKVDKNVGDERPTAGVESELDIEYIKGVAPDVPLTVVYNAQYSLLAWANQISSMEDAPYVHSVSYGNDEVQQSGVSYMKTCNTAFMKAGARGLSILFASGDQGVCGRSGCGLIQHARFHPDFPAASPYITAVGGTDFVTKGVVGDEKAWASSGGGFSDTFAIPDWQKDAVDAYKKSPDAALPPAKLWNNTGRGYPDVSALGGQVNPYCVVTGGSFMGVAGTSASTPVVAGVFALLNGLRLAKKMKPLGFLNPFIYQNSGAFQDVKAGVNGGGRVYGFKAIQGWDAATGWGTPDYELLVKAMGLHEEPRVGSIIV